MSKTFAIDIVTPINTSNFMDVEYLRAPSTEGLFGVLPGHISSIIALDIGEIKIIKDKKTLRFSTSGGFADIKKDKVVLVLETVEEYNQIDIKRAKDSLSRSEKRLSDKSIDIEKARISIKRAKNRIAIANKKD